MPRDEELWDLAEKLTIRQYDMSRLTDGELNRTLHLLENRATLTDVELAELTAIVEKVALG